MGIINITDDSFYKASRRLQLHDILATATTMIADGATILDIGGQSTRPGSKQISAAAEIAKVVPAIEAILKELPNAIISIDTYWSAVARAAVEAGAVIVNDISAGSIDAALIDTVAALNVPYVLMHMQGTPATMQQQPHYKNVTQEVLDFLIKKTGELRNSGINDIIIDPGFGFGKTIEHNFELLKNFSLFKMVECPVLLGLSRKATVYKTLNITPENALNGTTVLNTVGLLNGASILRVHDVKEAVEAVKLIARI